MQPKNLIIILILILVIVIIGGFKVIAPKKLKVEITEKSSTICPSGHIDLKGIYSNKKTLKELTGINFCLDKKIAKNIEVPGDISPVDGKLSLYISEEDRPDNIDLVWGTYNVDTHESYIKHIKEDLPKELKNIEITSEKDLQFENSNITGREIIFSGRFEDVAEEFSCVNIYRTVLKCTNDIVVMESVCGCSYPECHNTHKEILDTLTCESI